MPLFIYAQLSAALLLYSQATSAVFMRSLLRLPLPPPPLCAAWTTTCRTLRASTCPSCSTMRRRRTSCGSWRPWRRLATTQSRAAARLRGPAAAAGIGSSGGLRSCKGQQCVLALLLTSPHPSLPPPPSAATWAARPLPAMGAWPAASAPPPGTSALQPPTRIQRPRGRTRMPRSRTCGKTDAWVWVRLSSSQQFSPQKNRP